MTTRDDGEPICYYYIDDIESVSSGGDKHLDYYQSKAMCEQRGKQCRRTTRVSKPFYEMKNRMYKGVHLFFCRCWMGARGR